MTPDKKLGQDCFIVRDANGRPSSKTGRRRSTKCFKDAYFIDCDPYRGASVGDASGLGCVQLPKAMRSGPLDRNEML
jgi:hypothetical protein